MTGFTVCPVYALLHDLVDVNNSYSLAKNEMYSPAKMNIC